MSRPTLTVRWPRPGPMLLIALAGVFAAPAPITHAATKASEGWHQREFDALVHGLGGDRARPDSFALLHRLWDLRYGLGDDPALAKVFEAIAADEQAHPLLRDHALWNRAALHTRRGEIDSTAAVMERLGFPADLELVGPFENLGDAGRDEPFEPELPESGAGPFDGAQGPVRWRRLARLGRLGRVDLAGLLQRSQDVVAYVRATVHSDRDVDATVRLGTDDSYKLWVNGQPAGEFSGKRTAEFDQEARPVKLRKGDNELLLKLAWTGGGGTFYLRVDPGPAWHPLTAAQSSVDARGAAASDVDWGILGELHLLFGPNDRAEEPDAAAFREALKTAVGARRAHWTHALGRSLGADENARRQAYEESWRLAREHAGDAVPSAAALVRHYRSRREAAKATLWSQRLADDDPTHLLVVLEGADRLVAAGSRRIALLGIDEARAARPGIPAFHRRAADLRRDLEDRRGQVEALERYLQLEASSGQRLRELCRWRLTAGDLQGALKARRRILQLWPYSLSDWQQVAALLADNGRESDAVTEYERIAAAFPESAAPLEAQGRLLHRLGRTDEALTAMDAALELKPQNHALRRYVRHLRPGEESLEERYAVPIDDALRLPPATGAAEVGASTALAVSAVRVHENGLSSRFHQRVVRLDSRAQLDGWRSIPISFIPGQELVEVLLAERIDSAGERHKPTRVRTEGPFGKSQGMYMNNKVRRIEFSDVRVGDTLHVRYRVDEIGSRNMFGDYFGNVVNLQRSVPARRLIQVYELPKARPLHHAGRGAGEPTVTQRGPHTVYRWTWEDVPPHLREPHMPGYPEVGMFLSVSTYKDWDEMARWYAKLIKDQFELEEEDKALVRRLVEGATTVEEKVARLHGYVVANTRYVGIEFGIHGFKPYRAGRVLRRGYGDCKDKATLLSAMLAEVGVEARVALLRTVGRGRLDPTPATLWAFNHAITYIPSLDRWIDGTHELAGSSELPPRDQGAMALVVGREGQGRLTTTPVMPASTNAWRTRSTGFARADGDIEVQVEESVTGYGAESLRRAFQDVSKRAQKLEKMLSRHHPGVKVTSIDIEGIEDIERSPVLRFDSVLPGLLDIDAEGGGVAASLPVVLYRSRLTERVAPGSERLYDVRLDHPWTESSDSRLTLPEGWSVKSLPDDFAIDTPHGTASITTSLQGREVVVTTALTVKQRRIPLDKYAALRAFARAVDRAEEGRIRLVRDP